ncbi:MAG TPA: AAA family ATPase [Methanocella sp.]|nr:AAA family ATPase [Methanocella sp.]
MTLDIAAIRTAFGRRFKERSVEINCSLLAILSGEHVLFLGPPGTAKSMLARSLCEIIDGKYFYYLLTRFTTPEEVFGPLSIRALQEDDFIRKTEGRLPEAHIAFLDEIFKANSSILNSFLTILNERKFHNGRNAIDVPLLSVFGASNELPADENLEALYDRFLFRCVVTPIQEEANFQEMLFGAETKIPDQMRLSVKTILKLQGKAEELPVDADTMTTVLSARRELAARQVSISDRRWKKMVRVLKVAAAASDRPSVDRSMILILQHMAWDRPEQRAEIKECLFDLLITGGESIEKLNDQISDLHRFISRSGDQPFPYAVRCYDCNEMIDTLKLLSAHHKLYPDHMYYDPYRTSLNLRFLPYDDLLHMFKDEHGWSFVEILPEQMRQCARDYADLRAHYTDLKRRVISDRDRLQALLRESEWISTADMAGILDCYEARSVQIERMGKTLSAIETIIGHHTRS